MTDEYVYCVLPIFLLHSTPKSITNLALPDDDEENVHDH